MESPKKLFLNSVRGRTAWGVMISCSDQSWLINNEDMFLNAGFEKTRKGTLVIQLQEQEDGVVQLPMAAEALLEGSLFSQINRPMPWVIPPEEMNITLVANVRRGGDRPTTVVVEGGNGAVNECLVYAGFNRTSSGTLYLASRDGGPFESHNEMFLELNRVIRIAASAAGLSASSVTTVFQPERAILGLAPLSATVPEFDIPSAWLSLQQQFEPQKPSMAKPGGIAPEVKDGIPPLASVIDERVKRGIEQIRFAIGDGNVSSVTVFPTAKGQILAYLRDQKLSRLDAISASEDGYNVHTRVDLENEHPVKATIVNAQNGEKISFLANEALNQFNVFATQIERNQPSAHTVFTGQAALDFHHESSWQVPLSVIDGFKDQTKPILNYLGEVVTLSSPRQVVTENGPVICTKEDLADIRGQCRFLLVDTEAAPPEMGVVILSALKHAAVPDSVQPGDVNRYLSPLIGDEVIGSAAYAAVLSKVVGVVNDPIARAQLIESEGEDFLLACHETLKLQAAREYEEAFGVSIPAVPSKHVESLASNTAYEVGEASLPCDDVSDSKANAIRLLTRSEAIIKEEIERQRKIARAIGASRDEIDLSALLLEVIRTDVTATGGADAVPGLTEMLMRQADVGRYPLKSDVAAELERQAWSWSREENTTAVLGNEAAAKKEALELAEDRSEEYSILYDTNSRVINDAEIHQNDQKPLGRALAGEGGLLAEPSGNEGHGTGQEGPGGSQQNVDRDGRSSGEGGVRSGGLGDVSDEVHVVTSGGSDELNRRLTTCQFLTNPEVGGDDVAIHANNAGVQLAFHAADNPISTLATARVTVADTSIAGVCIVCVADDLLALTNDYKQVILGFNIDDDLIAVDENGVRQCWHAPNYEIKSSEPVRVSPSRSGMQFDRTKTKPGFQVVTPLSVDQLKVVAFSPSSGLTETAASLVKAIEKDPLALKPGFESSQDAGFARAVAAKVGISLDEEALLSADIHALLDSYIRASFAKAINGAERFYSQQFENDITDDVTNEKIGDQKLSQIEHHARLITKQLTSDKSVQEHLISLVEKSLDDLNAGQLAPTQVLVQTGKFAYQALDIVTGKVTDSSHLSSERFVNPNHPVVVQTIEDMDFDISPVLPDLIRCNHDQDTHPLITPLAQETENCHVQYPVPQPQEPLALAKINNWGQEGPPALCKDMALNVSLLATPTVLSITFGQSLLQTDGDITEQPFFHERVAALAVCGNHPEYGNVRLLGQSSSGAWLYQRANGARISVDADGVIQGESLLLDSADQPMVYLLKRRSDKWRIAQPLNLGLVDWTKVSEPEGLAPCLAKTRKALNDAVEHIGDNCKSFWLADMDRALAPEPVRAVKLDTKDLLQIATPGVIGSDNHGYKPPQSFIDMVNAALKVQEFSKSALKAALRMTVKLQDPDYSVENGGFQPVSIGIELDKQDQAVVADVQLSTFDQVGVKSVETEICFHRGLYKFAPANIECAIADLVKSDREALDEILKGIVDKSNMVAFDLLTDRGWVAFNGKESTVRLDSVPEGTEVEFLKDSDIPEHLQGHVSVVESSSERAVLKIENLWLAKLLEGKIYNPHAASSYSLNNNGRAPYGLPVTGHNQSAVLSSMKLANAPAYTRDVYLLPAGVIESHEERRLHSESCGAPSTSVTLDLDKESTRNLMGAANAAASGLARGKAMDHFAAFLDSAPLNNLDDRCFLESFLFQQLNPTARELNKVTRKYVYQDIIEHLIGDLKSELVENPTAKSIGDLLPGGSANTFQIITNGQVVDTIFLPASVSEIDATERNIEMLKSCLYEQANCLMHAMSSVRENVLVLDQTLDQWHQEEPRIEVKNSNVLMDIRKHLDSGKGVLLSDSSLYRYDQLSERLEIATKFSDKIRVSKIPASQIQLAFEKPYSRPRYPIRERDWASLLMKQDEWFDSPVYFGAWPSSLVNNFGGLSSVSSFTDKSLADFLRTESAYEGLPDNSSFALWQWKKQANEAKKLISGLTSNKDVALAESSLKSMEKEWHDGMSITGLSQNALSNSYASARYTKERNSLSDKLVTAKANLEKTLAITVSGDIDNHPGLSKLPEALTLSVNRQLASGTDNVAIVEQGQGFSVQSSDGQQGVRLYFNHGFELQELHILALEEERKKSILEFDFHAGTCSDHKMSIIYKDLTSYGARDAWKKLHLLVERLETSGDLKHLEIWPGFPIEAQKRNALNLLNWQESLLPANELAEAVWHHVIRHDPASKREQLQLVTGEIVRVSQNPGLNSVTITREDGIEEELTFAQVFGEGLDEAMTHAATDLEEVNNPTLPWVQALATTLAIEPEALSATTSIFDAQVIKEAVHSIAISSSRHLLSEQSPLRSLATALEGYLQRGRNERSPQARYLEAGAKADNGQIQKIASALSQVVQSANALALPVIKKPEEAQPLPAGEVGVLVKESLKEELLSYLNESDSKTIGITCIGGRPKIHFDGKPELVENSANSHQYALNLDFLGDLWLGKDQLNAVMPSGDFKSLKARPIAERIVKGSVSDSLNDAMTQAGWLPLREGQGWPKIRERAVANKEPNPDGAKGGVRISSEVLPTQTVLEASSGPETVSSIDQAISAKEPFIVGKQVGQGGSITKSNNNLAAIETLLKLRREGRIEKATQEEREILNEYVGWGGIPQIFPKPSSGEYSSDQWRERGERLKDLLSRDEYDAARRSTLNAHYTSNTVIDAIYAGLEKIGFGGKSRICEPSVGTGLFIGRMPSQLREEAEVQAIELDAITANIATALYSSPSVKIHNKGFQEFHSVPGSFDAVVGNPPYGNYRIFDPHNPDISGSIHNVFILKGLRLLRPGGVQAFVISRYVMDSHDDKIRQAIAKEAELLGAVRLPDDAFAANAGTRVVTDILVLQKRLEPLAKPPADCEWIKTVNVDVEPESSGKSEKVRINQFFADHPERVLGQAVLRSGMYGKGYTVEADEDWQNSLTSALTEQLPEAVYDPDLSVANTHMTAASVGAILGQPEGLDVSRISPGCMFIHQGVVYMREHDYDDQFYAEPVDERLGSNGKPVKLKNVDYKRLEGLLGLRDAVDSLLDAEEANAEPSALDQMRTGLNHLYDSFVKKHGPVNRSTNANLLRQDPSYVRVMALEKNYQREIKPGNRRDLPPQDEKAIKADIFHERVAGLTAEIALTAETPADALALSLRQTGRADVEFMLEALGEGWNHGKLLDELGDDLFMDPESGEYEWGPLYLSGNVRSKLKIAQAAAIDNPDFERNVTALLDNQPKTVPFEEIYIAMGAHWLPKRFLVEFLREKANNTSLVVGAVYSSAEGRWHIDLRDNATEALMTLSNEWSTKRKKAEDIIDAALANKTLRVVDVIYEDGRQKRVTNEEESLAANNLVEKLKRDFKVWIGSTPSRAREIEETYNEKVNITKRTEIELPKGYYPTGLVSPGVFTPRPHQLRYVFRSLIQRNIAAVHFAGAGKTAAEIIATMEQVRTGQIRKGLIVVPNHLTQQWAVSVQLLYPKARILCPSKQDFQTRNRERMFARMATSNYDIMIIAHSQLIKLPTDYEIQADFIRDEISQLQEAVVSAEADYTVKQLEKRAASLTEKLEQTLQKMGNDIGVSLKQIGIDKITVDESHNFKNLPFVTALSEAGLGNPKGSLKAFNLGIHTAHLEKMGGSLALLSATPLSNSIAEMYAFLRYSNPQALRDRGIHSFDSWVNLFAEVESKLELSMTGDSYRTVSRLASFKNIPELMDMYLEVADCVSPEHVRQALEAAGGKWFVPEIKSGKPELIVVPQTADQEAIYAELNARMELLEDPSTIVDPKTDNKLKILTDARKAALHPRMFDTDSDELVVGKMAACIQYVDKQANGMIEKYKHPGLHLIFCDLGVPKGAKDRERAKLDNILERMESLDDAEREKAEKEYGEYSPTEVISILDSEEFGFQDAMREAITQRLGLNPSQVASLHDCKSDNEKQELFDRCNRGEIQVLFATTSKGGEGMHVSRYAAGVSNLDAPFRPSDFEQRIRRVVRQGNFFFENDPNFEVYVGNFATERSSDPWMYQTLESKAKALNGIIYGSAKDRSIEEVGIAADDFGAMKALATGDDLVKRQHEAMTLAKDIAVELQTQSDRYNRYHRDLSYLTSKCEHLPLRIQNMLETISRLDEYPNSISVPVANPKNGMSEAKERSALHVDMNGKIFGETQQAGRALAFELLRDIKSMRNIDRTVARVNGLELQLHCRKSINSIELALVDPNNDVAIDFHLPKELNPDSLGGVIKNKLSYFKKELAEAKMHLQRSEVALQQLKSTAAPTIDDTLREKHNQALEESERLMEELQAIRKKPAQIQDIELARVSLERYARHRGQQDGFDMAYDQFELRIDHITQVISGGETVEISEVKKLKVECSLKLRQLRKELGLSKREEIIQENLTMQEFEKENSDLDKESVVERIFQLRERFNDLYEVEADDVSALLQELVVYQEEVDKSDAVQRMDFDLTMISFDERFRSMESKYGVGCVCSSEEVSREIEAVQREFEFLCVDHQQDGRVVDILALHQEIVAKAEQMNTMGGKVHRDELATVIASTRGQLSELAQELGVEKERESKPNLAYQAQEELELEACESANHSLSMGI